MTPRIITYFLCGMRHPTTGLSEGDLSRLTGSSSSSASSCSGSSSSSSSPSLSSSPTPSHSEQHHQTSSSVAIVATDVNGTKTIATAARDNKDIIQSSGTLDAELLKNLKNSSTTSAATTTTKNHTHLTNQKNNNNNFNSSYLPEFIDPLDWQKSRKRKERLDSNSSTTQDRKLIRSNSEELLPPTVEGQQDQQQQQEGVLKNNPDCISPKLAKQQIDAIRRVASEDFKRTPYCSFELRSESADAAVLDPKAKQSASELALNANGNENDASIINRQQQQPTVYEPLPPAYSETLMSGPTKDMTRRSRLETSPARSHRHSPNRNGSSGGSKYHRDSDDSECEHERRRSSERFCKSRAPPGRKAPGVMKKSGKYLPTKMRGDENSYKYDLSALKYERRGFVSKKLPGNAAGAADHNDNNLIDFHIMQNTGSSSSKSADANAAASKKVSPVSPNAAADATKQAQPNQRSSNANVNQQQITTSAEALPWGGSSGAADTEPILSRRYAAVRHRPSDCIDTAAKLSKVMPYPQQFHKQAPAQLMSDDCIDPMLTFRAFTSLENIKTHDVLHQVIPAMMSFQTPDERLKQVSKRLTALKKKLGQFEEAFETRMGYRPSQAEKLNDRYMKNVLAEMSKLRKEKHELKSNPMGGGMGMKVSGGMDGVKKLEKMRISMDEIEQNLVDKREDANRSEALEELSADQLLQEKTAVQHGLLYFESLYGRPNTKDERDAARPLYDRYRQLKRMVSRSVTLSGCAGIGAPELPTILEHEAMVFESIPQQYSSNNSTDTTNSPSESVANTTTTTTTIASQASSEDDSTTTTTGNMEATASGTTTSTTSHATQQPQQSQTFFSENISALNIDQLWEQLDKTREEKKLLKRTIREFEQIFEEQNGRKMLKSDRKTIEETYAQYKEKKAKTRLLQALIKKHISR